MHNLRRRVKVIDGIKHLLEVKSCILLGETSSFILQFDEREEVALLNQLKHDEEDLDSFA